MLSPFDQAVIVSIDGMGEFDTVWCGVGQGCRMRPLYTLSIPHSLGQVYSAVTQYLGFTPFSDEYKVMGLSAYGKPRFIEKFREIISLDGPLYRIDTSYFSYFLGYKKRYSPKFERIFGLHRKEDESISETHKDIAASLQMRLSEVVCHMVEKAVEYSGIQNVCLSGGVALNSVANGLLIDKGIAKKLFIPHCVSDAGTSLGAALNAYYQSDEPKKRVPLNTAFLGPSYTNDYIERMLIKNKIDYRKSDNIFTEGSRLLARGGVLGFFQGRMEFRQRALGFYEGAEEMVAFANYYNSFLSRCPHNIGANCGNLSVHICIVLMIYTFAA
jgi:carbamoyltransferase